MANRKERIMDKKTLKMICIIMAALMVLAFSACGGKTEPEAVQDSGQAAEEKTDGGTDASSEDNAGYPRTMYVTSEDGLILRKEPGTDKEEIGGMGYGEEIRVEKVENGWAYTTFDGKSGWCSADYLTVDKNEIKPKDTSSDNEKNRIVAPANKAEGGDHYKINSEDGVNMRYGPGTDYDVIETIPDKAEVIEAGWEGDWTYIEYNGKNGWVKSEFISSATAYGKEKPVIYLYPSHTMDVSVRIDLTDGYFTRTIPESNGTWTVTAEPDGTLTDKASGKKYDYIFWESSDNTEYDWSEGYVIKGSETETFLRSILPKMGLKKKEYDEFIEYWLPRMKGNSYNLITFQTERYTESAKLTVSPQPDSVLRVFMAFRKLDRPVSVARPKIVPFERRGFTVVEWGGAEVR